MDGAVRGLGAIPGSHFRKAERTGKYTVKGGKTDYVLLTPRECDEFTEYAVAEFTELFRTATGIGIARKYDGEYSGNCISLGDTALSEEVSVPYGEYGDSGYRIVSVGDSYVLKGGGSRGVLYAAYDLLGLLFRYETFADKTVRIDKGVKDVPFYDTDIREVPDFRYRSPSHAYIKYNERLRNRFRMTELEEILGGEGGPYHNNFNFVPPEKFAALHPKWYSDDGTQMCYTAHGDESERKLLEREAAEAIARYIRSEPNMPYVAFNHQDNFEWCTCPACTALKEKYEGANSASAALFLSRVHGILKEILLKENLYKGQKLVFFAYHGTNAAPVHYDEETDTFSFIDGIGKLEGVVPWFAETNADYTCPLYEGEVNRPVARALRGWRHLSDEILFWTYGTDFENYLAPYYSFAATPETYKFAASCGAGMVFDECQINTAASTGWEELKGYLGARLAWNVNADVKSLTREFFEASYGKAASVMLKIFGEYLEIGARQREKGFSGWRSEFIDPVNREFWDKDTLERWDREMTIAVNAAVKEKSDIPYARNIALERASVRYLLCEVFGSEYAAPELALLRRCAASDMRECGIDMFNEKKKIDVLFDKWGV